MIRLLFGRIGLFGRTYAIMLASVLFAEGLIFVLSVVTPPPTFYVPVPIVANALRGQPQDRKFKLVETMESQPKLPGVDPKADQDRKSVV